MHWQQAMMSTEHGIEGVSVRAYRACQGTYTVTMYHRYQNTIVMVNTLGSLGHGIRR